MRHTAKFFSFILLGIVVSWLTFGLATELNTKNKAESSLESIGVIYRSNELYKNMELGEAQISYLIKQALAKNPKTATLNLNITTVGSRVTISGKAEEKEQIQSVVQIILKTPGVKEVISTIVVDPDIHIASKNTLL